MLEKSTAISAEILAELKKMNESLSYIKVVAQRLNEKENRISQAQADMAKFSRDLPKL